MTATNVVDMTLHRAYLEYRTESASNDVAEHVNGCNQCWSAVVMPGPGRLCAEGDRLAGAYVEAATGQRVEIRTPEQLAAFVGEA